MPSSCLRWWWIRHAPVAARGRRNYGHQDLPADLSDTKSFAALAAFLPKAPHWIVTPLQRTRQTLDAIAAAGGFRATPVVEPRFIEQDFGAWEDMENEDIRRQFGVAASPFWLAPADATPPDGESFASLMRRCGEAIDTLSAALAPQGEAEIRDVVCIAHSGTIRAAIGHLHGLTPERSLGFTVNNLAVSRFDRFAPVEAEKSGATLSPIWRTVWINRPAQ